MTRFAACTAAVLLLQLSFVIAQEFEYDEEAEAYLESDEYFLEELEDDPGEDPLEAFPNKNASLLFIAAAAGDIAGIKRELDGGVRIDVQDDKGKSALMHATENNHPHAIAFLLKKGAGWFVRDYEHRSPMFLAAELGYPEALKAFLEHDELHGWDRNVVSGLTVAHHCCKSGDSPGHLEIIRMLAEDYFVAIDDVEIEGKTCLDFPYSNKMKKQLLKWWPDVPLSGEHQQLDPEM